MAVSLSKFTDSLTRNGLISIQEITDAQTELKRRNLSQDAQALAKLPSNSGFTKTSAATPDTGAGRTSEAMPATSGFMSPGLRNNMEFDGVTFAVRPFLISDPVRFANLDAVDFGISGLG